MHVGFIRMTGCTLNSVDQIPPRVLAHIAAQLGIVGPQLASMRTLYRHTRTLYRHHVWALEQAGWATFTEHRRRALFAHLNNDARHVTGVHHLVQDAKSWLFENRIQIPAEWTLLRIARRAFEHHEKRSAVAIDAAIPKQIRDKWMASLFAQHGPHETVLDWLKRPPGKLSPATIDRALEKVEFLQALGVDRYDVPGISHEQQRVFAARVRGRRPVRFQAIAEPRRTIELVCFMRATLMLLHDILIDLSLMQRKRIFGAVKEDVMSRRRPQPVEDRVRWLKVNDIIDASISAEEKVAQIKALIPPTIRSAGLANELREQLSCNARRTRRLAKVMMKIQFHTGTTAGPIKKAIKTLRAAYEAKAVSLPDGEDHAFAPSWKDHIQSEDRKQAMRAFEAATLQALDRGLRNGTVWCGQSRKYRSRDEILISGADWRKSRTSHYRHMHLPLKADRYLKPLLSSLEEGLESLAAAVKGGKVSIDGRGLHLEALVKEDQPEELDQAKRELIREVGCVQLPDLLVEMDYLTGFSRCLLGRAARSEKELQALYGGLMAHGMGHCASTTAMTIRGMSETMIRSAMRVLEDSNGLHEANAALVEFLDELSIAENWGNKTMASSDAMTLDTSRHLWNARIDAKRKRYGMGVYTHARGDSALIYNQPLPLGQREAGAASEGMMRHVSNQVLEHLAVDTLGYTDFAMGLCKLLGFDLCPRLKDLRYRRLHVPNGMSIPDELLGVVSRDLRVGLIDAGWDSMARVAASIEGNVTSATLALERFGSASRGDPIYKAGTQLGRLNRTLYLADFCTLPSFRREILRCLNYGEATNFLKRAIHPGALPSDRGRRHEELVAVSGSLTLLANVVISGMAYRLQLVLDRRRRSGKAVPSAEILRHISPARFGAINMRGRYTFPINRHAGKLLSEAA